VEANRARTGMDAIALRRTTRPLEYEAACSRKSIEMQALNAVRNAAAFDELLSESGTSRKLRKGSSFPLHGVTCHISPEDKKRLPVKSDDQISLRLHIAPTYQAHPNSLFSTWPGLCQRYGLQLKESTGRYEFEVQSMYDSSLRHAMTDPALDL